MIVNINQIIRNVLNEDRTIKSTQTSETFVLTPETGKHLVNTKTGEEFFSMISLGSRWKVSDFIEVKND